MNDNTTPNTNTNPRQAMPAPPPTPRTRSPRAARRRRPGLVLALLLCLVGAVTAWNTRDLWLPGRAAPIPVPYLITATEYVCEDMSRDGARFAASFKIDIFGKRGWQKIELLPAKVAIVSATLPKHAYLHLADGMYYVLTDQKGEIDVELAFAVAPTESDGTFSVLFERVPSVTCSLDATFADDAIDVTVDGAQSVAASATNGTTRVAAILPDNTPISLSWEKSLPEIVQGPSEYYTETKTLVSIAEGLIVGDTRIDFTILHTPTRELRMKVPTGVSVLSLVGKGILDWREAAGELTVQLEKEVLGAYTLDIRHESSPDMTAGKVSVPVITGVGVVREKGDIGIVALTNVEVEDDTAVAAECIDVKDLSSTLTSMTTQPILLAYRYVDPEFEIGLNISKHAGVDVLMSIIDRASASVMQTLDGKRMTRVVYNVRNNRNQFLRLALPKDAELWSASVDGKPVQPAQDDEGRVLLPLSRSQGHMPAFPVEIVYAEAGDTPDAKGAGTAHIELPVCSEPIMHMTVSLHVPASGKYRNFEGPLRAVDAFTAFGHDDVQVRVQNAPNQMGQQISQLQIQGAAVRHNAVDIKFPMTGEVYRFEKILIVKDAQWLAYDFSKFGT